MASGTLAEEAYPDRGVDRRRVAEFLAITFGLSWTSALGLYLAGVDIATIRGLVLTTVLFMWAPAVAALVVLYRHGDPIRANTGLRRGRLGWVLLAWLLPAAFVGLTVAAGTLLPGVSFTTDYGAYLLEAGLSPEQVDAAVDQLESVPGPPALLFLVQGLLAGLTLNALAALGEELGWRGLLLTELRSLGFWRLSGITGVIWGVWHAPVILQGHNFPDAPVAGVAVMTVATVALSPVYTYVTVRAESVLAATFFHGSFNGLGAVALVYLAGAGNLLVSPVGVAGVGAAVLLTGCCIVHDLAIADEAITTGDPLQPWE